MKTLKYVDWILFLFSTVSKSCGKHQNYFEQKVNFSFPLILFTSRLIFSLDPEKDKMFDYPYPTLLSYVAVVQGNYIGLRIQILQFVWERFDRYVTP